MTLWPSITSGIADDRLQLKHVQHNFKIHSILSSLKSTCMGESDSEIPHSWEKLSLNSLLFSMLSYSAKLMWSLELVWVWCISSAIWLLCKSLKHNMVYSNSDCRHWREILYIFNQITANDLFQEQDINKIMHPEIEPAPVRFRVMSRFWTLIDMRPTMWGLWGI